MKNLTSYLLATALLASPVLLVQAAEQQPVDGQQTEQAQNQQAPTTPPAAPAPSEQGGGDQPEGIPSPAAPEQENQPEGMGQPSEPADETPEQPSAAGGSKFIEEESAQETLASNLMGYSVTNLQGQNVGQVEDLILDQDNRPVGLVISVGGFLGLGAKHVALPMSEFQINRENKVVQVSFSKEELNKAPSFKAQAPAQGGQEESAPADGGTTGQ